MSLERAEIDFAEHDQEQRDQHDTGGESNSHPVDEYTRRC